MAVHGELGPGFLEAVYQEPLALEFTERGVPFRREVELPVSYKGRPLSTPYRADFVCCDAVVVELKALAQLGGTEEAHALNYLKASGLDAGLLLNFRKASLEFRRFVFRPSVKSA